MKLTQRVALVTGAGSGLGRQMAFFLAQQGAKVACLDLSGDAAAQTVSEIEAGGGSAMSVAFNLADLDNISGVFSSIEQTLGFPTVLVNCAAFYCREAWDELNPKSLTLSAAVNVSAPILLIQKMAEHCQVTAGSSGVAICVLSDSAYKLATRVGYAATKAGLGQAGRCFAKVLADAGIFFRVNSMCPGLMNTPMAATIPSEQLAALLKTTTSGELIDPAVMARHILDMILDDSVNGVVINRTNGFLPDIEEGADVFAR